MPTGYTAALYEGKPQTFEEFVMGCSRAMGALVMMREEPSDAPIPEEFKPSPYYARAVVKAQDDLDEATARSLDDWKRWEAKRVRDDERMRQESRDKALATRSRYEEMLAEVEAWTPPTDDHTGFKEFMADQLRESIKFDCTPLDWPPEKPKRTAEQARSDEVARLRQRLTSEQKNRDEEYERAAGRTEWVRALRDSLEAVPA